ncbi:hypothetical protein H9P43_005134 [Blastocladiella emersonii ATCC 22665]|nr:hypothetical protein H9P43_005134 [Blastocladiella emersonii ATCC 22665]
MPSTPRRSPSPVKETFHVRRTSVETPPAGGSPLSRPRTPSLLHVQGRAVDAAIAASATMVVNQYLVLGEIGAGSYGKVARVHNLEDGNDYACKILSKSRLRRQFRMRAVYAGVGGGAGGGEDGVKQEVAVFKKLSSSHPNITSLLEVLDDVQEDNLYLVFELCAGPIMTLSMGERAEPFDEGRAAKYFRDVVLGLEFLHYHGIIHCDLKPENILVTWDDRAQISDFGIAHMCHGQVDDHVAIRSASPAFTPPEACDPSSLRVHGRALDMWCLGVTLYCLTHGYPPFEACYLMELYAQIAADEPEISSGLSPDLQDLLRGLLRKDPATRTPLAGVKTHAWTTYGGTRPMLSTDENCVCVVTVTDEDVASAVVKVGLFGRLLSRLRGSGGVASPSGTGNRASWPGAAPPAATPAPSTTNISTASLPGGPVAASAAASGAGPMPDVPELPTPPEADADSEPAAPAPALAPPMSVQPVAVNMSATTSQVFRSWLLWGSAATGLVYGFVRDARLSTSEAAKREAAAKAAELAHFHQARAAYAAHKAAEAAKLAPPSAAGVVADPDSPDFDLEKLINSWDKAPAA